MISSAALYAPGAFFFYPHKPLGQLFSGDPYDVGYRYFRRDHTVPRNLALHVVALLWTMGGNFGLLAAIDRAIPLGSMVGLSRPLSAFTAAVWSGMLLSSPAPAVVSVLSSLFIWASYMVAPAIGPRELELGSMALFAVVLVLAKVLAQHRSKTLMRELLADMLYMFKVFGLALAARLVAKQWAGALAHQTAMLNPLLLVLMTALSMLPKPTVPAVLGGALIARPLGELTSQDALLFYGAAFVAQSSQGVAHEVTRQKATLLSHEGSEEDRSVKLAFEWSHCVWFPNLLFHSIYESATSQNVPESSKD